MQVSEMNFEQLIRCAGDVSGAVARIGTDSGVLKAFADYSIKVSMKKHMTVLEKYALLFEGVIPSLMVCHYDDVMEIASACLGVSLEDLKARNGFQTIIDLKDFFEPIAQMLGA